MSGGVKQKWINQEMTNDSELSSEAQARQTADQNLQNQITNILTLRQQIYDSERLTSLATASTSAWNTYLTLATPALQLGSYRLDYQWVGTISNNSRSIEFRVVRNGVTVYQSIKFASSSSEPLSASRFIKFANISGVQNISIDFRVGPNGNTTATITEAQLTLERVGV